MRLRIVVGEACSSILSAWSRSILALFGIAVGIGSVIAMITIGEIVAAASLAQFRDLGTDLITLSRRAGAGAGRGAGTIVPEAVERLPLEVAGVAAAAAWTDTRAAVGYRGGALGPRPIVGVTPGFARVARLVPAEGRLLTALDARSAHCVVGAGVARALAARGTARAVGARVRVGGRLLTVVGALAPAGPRDLLGLAEPDAALYVPIATLRRVTQAGPPGQAVIRVPPGADAGERALAAAAFLTARAGGPLALEARSAEQLIAQARRQTELFTVLLGSIGAIALIVGGVGVMNLMLTGVTERRTEIGLRRAIGARRRDVRRQFMSEAVVLCLIGGALGLALGAGATFAVCLVAGLDFALSGAAVVLAVLTSSAIGVFFGLYPAHRAARLDPVAALRG